MRGHENEEVLTSRIRELLERVVKRQDVMEVNTVIHLLKHMDEVPVGHHREILEILQSFRSLPQSAQDRLLPILSAALERSGDKD